MMSEDNYYKNLWTLGIYYILSTVFVGLSILFIVITNDNIVYQFYEICDDLVTSGVMNSGILAFIEGVATVVVGMLSYVDKFWLISFLVFVICYLQSSYHAKREGYLSIFGFISFGIMATLFVFNLLVTYNQSIYNLLFNFILSGVSTELIFFSLYMENFQIVNLILICLGLIVNFVPFDIAVFRNRKKEDTLQEIS